MNRHWGSIDCKSQLAFKLRFQQALTDYLGREGSLAEGFGIVWERTLEQVPLDDDAQGQTYRHLLAWAKSDELFNRRKADGPFHSYRQAAHRL